MRGDILFLLVYWAFWICPFVIVLGLDYREMKWEEAQIRAARETELAEGVTVEQGIRAYYGTSGYWGVRQGEASVYAGYPHAYTGVVCVNLETGEVTVHVYNANRTEKDSDAVVKAMISAARKGERGPWP